MNKWDTINKPDQLSDPGWDFRGEEDQPLLDHILKTPLEKLDTGDFLCLFGSIAPAGNTIENLYYFRSACAWVLNDPSKSAQLHEELTRWVSRRHEELSEMGFLSLCLDELQPIWEEMIGNFSRNETHGYWGDDFLSMIFLLIHVDHVTFLNSFLHEEMAKMSAENAFVFALNIVKQSNYAKSNTLHYFSDSTFDHPIEIEYVFEEFPSFDLHLDQICTKLLTENNKDAIKAFDALILSSYRANQPSKMCLFKEIRAIPLPLPEPEPEFDS